MEAILGQERAVHVLQSALSTGRLHHAYIFHGPVGVGKFTSARAFARILLCHARQTDLVGRVSACGSCPSCRLMHPTNPILAGPAKGKRGKSKDDAEEVETEELDEADVLDHEPHPDYHVIRKELAAVSFNKKLRDRKQMNIPIDLLRERMIGGEIEGNYYDSLAFKTAALNHGKVFIIDEAELLDDRSQNALLKTLEEPPKDTFMILVTSSEDQLLRTIRSRCQRVCFTALSESIIADWLGKNATHLNEAQAQWLSRFVGGSLGRAELSIKYELYNWAKVALPAINEMTKDRYPAELGGQITDLINAFAERWVSEHAGASKEAANKRAAGLMWAMISQHARNKINDLAPRCPADDPVTGEAMLQPWFGAIEAVQEAERTLASNVNMSITCDALVAALFQSLGPVAITHRA
ncbi:MAG: DNA polymerase III subunit [Phycisphaeraceae bacterium]